MRKAATSSTLLSEEGVASLRWLPQSGVTSGLRGKKGLGRWEGGLPGHRAWVDTSMEVASLGASGKSGLVGNGGPFPGTVGVQRERQREQIRWVQCPAGLGHHLLTVELGKTLGESVNSSRETGEAPCDMAYPGLTSRFTELLASLPWRLSPPLVVPCFLSSARSLVSWLWFPEPAGYALSSKGEKPLGLCDDSAWDGTGRPLSFGFKQGSPGSNWPQPQHDQLAHVSSLTGGTPFRHS